MKLMLHRSLCNNSRPRTTAGAPSTTSSAVAESGLTVQTTKAQTFIHESMRTSNRISLRSQSKHRRDMSSSLAPSSSATMELDSRIRRKQGFRGQSEREKRGKGARIHRLSRGGLSDDGGGLTATNWKEVRRWTAGDGQRLTCGDHGLRVLVL